MRSRRTGLPRSGRKWAEAEGRQRRRLSQPPMTERQVSFNRTIALGHLPPPHACQGLFTMMCASNSGASEVTGQYLEILP